MSSRSISAVVYFHIGYSCTAAVNCNSNGGNGKCVELGVGTGNYKCTSCSYGGDVINGACPASPCTTSANCNSAMGGGVCVPNGDRTSNYTCTSCNYGGDVINGACPASPCTTSTNCNSAMGGGVCQPIGNGNTGYKCADCTDGVAVINGPCATCPIGGKTITFDDIQAQNAQSSPIPSNYYGFAWTRANYQLATNAPNSNYVNLAGSGLNVAFFYQPPMIIQAVPPNGPFALYSIFAVPLYSNAMVLNIIGYDTIDVPLYNISYSLNNGSVVTLNINWTGLNRVEMSSTALDGAGPDIGLKSFCITGPLVQLVCPTGQTGITFNDISTGAATSGLIPSNYGGFAWVNAMYTRAPAASTQSPFSNLAGSDAYIASFNTNPMVMQVGAPNGPFILYSGFAVALYSNALLLNITGYDATGVLLYSTSYTLNTRVIVPLNLNWTGLNRVEMSSTALDGVAQDVGLKDLCISSPVVEAVCPTGQTGLTFNDIITGGATSGLIPSNYSGFAWVNAMYTRAPAASTQSPFSNLAGSDAYIASFNTNPMVMQVAAPNGPFTLYSGFAIALYSNSLLLNITGYDITGGLLYSTSYTLNTRVISYLNLNWTGLNRVEMSSMALDGAAQDIGLKDLCISSPVVQPTCPSGQTGITFNVSTTGGATSGLIPSNYDGFAWVNAMFTQVPAASTQSPFSNLAGSDTYIASFNNSPIIMQVTPPNGPFTLYSGFAIALYSNSLLLNITGYDATGALLYSTSYSLNTRVISYLNLNWTGLNRVEVSSTALDGAAQDIGFKDLCISSPVVQPVCPTGQSGMTFNDITTGGASSGQIPSNYGGFGWYLAMFTQAPAPNTQSPYSNMAGSDAYVASFNTNPMIMQIAPPNGPFTLYSGFAIALYSNSLLLNISGYDATGALLYSTSYSLNTRVISYLNLNWTGLNRVEMSSTALDGAAQDIGLKDLCVSSLVVQPVCPTGGTAINTQNITANFFAPIPSNYYGFTWIGSYTVQASFQGPQTAFANIAGSDSYTSIVQYSPMVLQATPPSGPFTFYSGYVVAASTTTASLTVTGYNIVGHTLYNTSFSLDNQVIFWLNLNWTGLDRIEMLLTFPDPNGWGYLSFKDFCVSSPQVQATCPTGGSAITFDNSTVSGSNQAQIPSNYKGFGWMNANFQFESYIGSQSAYLNLAGSDSYVGYFNNNPMIMQASPPNGPFTFYSGYVVAPWTSAATLNVTGYDVTNTLLYSASYSLNNYAILWLNLNWTGLDRIEMISQSPFGPPEIGFKDFCVSAPQVQPACPVGETAITFDNNTVPGSNQSQVPSNYKGFAWINANVIAANLYGTQQVYLNFAGSDSYVGYFNHNPMIIQASPPNGPFTFYSGYVVAPWTSAAALNVTGYDVTNTLLYSASYSLNNNAILRLNLNWTGLNRIEMMSQSSSGYADIGFKDFCVSGPQVQPACPIGGTAITFDNSTVPGSTNAPIPSSYKGFAWTNGQFLLASISGIPTAYANLAGSDSYIGWFNSNPLVIQASSSNGPFSFYSGYVVTSYSSSCVLNVAGYSASSALLYNTSYSLNNFVIVRLNLNWTGLGRIEMNSLSCSSYRDIGFKDFCLG
ncbi:unnamed protein product [Adineta ricciae]|uniref:Uncharacterized protein n=1 Tax=Adineta ricciae TaxID=249248 RepID=A0A815VML0_ADIRI|nr:unnamed protein product [Adineta ricciae]CAF1532388.1 unnamed protein product [Adineta ricciae]